MNDKDNGQHPHFAFVRISSSDDPRKSQRPFYVPREAFLEIVLSWIKYTFLQTKFDVERAIARSRNRRWGN